MFVPGASCEKSHLIATEATLSVTMHYTNGGDDEDWTLLPGTNYDDVTGDPQRSRC